jgi:uncharacterized protein YjbI with pentapeptide repeats
MNLEKLSEQITQKLIEDIDISLLDIDGLDFTGCKLKNVILANDSQQTRIIKNANFKDAILENVSFDSAVLENCNFDKSKDTQSPTLSRVSFKNCKMIACRFRNATIEWCDFRYSEISQVTFEGAKIDFCDFYRTFFLGVGIFRKSLISNSSLYYTYFDEGSTIRRDNLVDGKILQQNKNLYRKFLIDWNTYGTGERKNNQQNSKSDWSPENSLKTRYADAEDIFKSLNGLWTSKGFLGDSNWAYVQGKKMERNRLIAELTNNKISVFQKLKKVKDIIMNFILDIFFGYGESMTRMILTYIFVVMLFAYIYYSSQDVSIASYSKAIGVSLKNMVAMSPDDVKNISPFQDFLNVIQTTIGILLTGIFGFILGNKIRNQ